MIKLPPLFTLPVASITPFTFTLPAEDMILIEPPLNPFAEINVFAPM